MNSLRPGDKVVYQIARVPRTYGRVESVWRDSHLKIKWSDGATDTFSISDEEGKYLSLNEPSSSQARR